jgi:hypothetical protein
MAGSKLFLTISVVLSAFVLPPVMQGAVAQERIQERGANPGIQDRAVQPSPRFAGASETTGMAPVGHRQPTLKGLPDSARDISRPAVDPLGPLPKICNQC